ncbi:DUF488 family protein, N3 subclade [Komarekiella delphini-convector]|uniref:DUF488 family protein, N3 subclade n=1 Tax=Komarekiella delphini-convector TaxID=3050158 RepID=UPI001CD8F6BE|nr:DUF488 family protein [Komarekiella delphini-convector]
MSIYTSYYAGTIKGEAVSISLYPPKRFQGRHLSLFAPTPELLKWWKSSVKDATAQQEYKRQFREILDSRQQLIDLWVRKQLSASADITLCCFEKTGDFCHRYQVGEEVVQAYLPEQWGGEINAAQKPQLQIIPGGKAIYPPQVKSLIEKCHESAFPVQCDRLPCGYYRVSLHGEDLGDWSELGILGVLSGLQEFYRGRLLPGLAAVGSG